MLPTLDNWLQYYEQNARHPDVVPWDTKEVLTSAESRTIAKSIAAFQLGEYSEGTGLMRFAVAYARIYGDDRLESITRLFVAEEQNHAALLRRFMETHGLPRLRQNWTDTVFRKLRRASGYEWSITVLITAEIIALTYYKVLRNCTRSVVLRAICQKILADEAAHVRYESSLINYLQARKPASVRASKRFRQRFLYCGTVLVVYVDHRRVIRGGGYSFLEFWRACWAEFRTCFPVGGQDAGVAPSGL